MACFPQPYHSHPPRLEAAADGKQPQPHAAVGSASSSHFFARTSHDRIPTAHSESEAEPDSDSEQENESGPKQAAPSASASAAAAGSAPTTPPPSKADSASIAEMSKSAQTIEREQLLVRAAAAAAASASSQSQGSSPSFASDSAAHLNTPPAAGFNPLPPLLSTAPAPASAPASAAPSAVLNGVVIHKLLRAHNFENKSERRRVRALPITTLRRVAGPASASASASAATPASTSAAASAAAAGAGAEGGKAQGPLRVFVKGTQYPGLAISRAFGDINVSALSAGSWGVGQRLFGH